MIRHCDKLWQEHLLTMDHLRSDVNLRTVGQRDPLMEFKQEAFVMFEEFSRTVREEIAHALFSFEITIMNPQLIYNNFSLSYNLETNRSFSDELNLFRRNSIQQINLKKALQPVVIGERTARNEFCPCGSGKKI